MAMAMTRGRADRPSDRTDFAWDFSKVDRWVDGKHSAMDPKGLIVIARPQEDVPLSEDDVIEKLKTYIQRWGLCGPEEKRGLDAMMGAVSAAAKKTWDDALRRVRADMSKDATTSGRRTRGGLEGASPVSDAIRTLLRDAGWRAVSGAAWQAFASAPCPADVCVMARGVVERRETGLFLLQKLAIVARRCAGLLASPGGGAAAAALAVGATRISRLPARAALATALLFACLWAAAAAACVAALSAAVRWCLHRKRSASALSTLGQNSGGVRAVGFFSGDPRDLPGTCAFVASSLDAQCPSLLSALLALLSPSIVTDAVLVDPVILLTGPSARAAHRAAAGATDPATTSTALLNAPFLPTPAAWTAAPARSLLRIAALLSSAPSPSARPSSGALRQIRNAAAAPLHGDEGAGPWELFEGRSDSDATKSDADGDATTDRTVDSRAGSSSHESLAYSAPRSSTAPSVRSGPAAMASSDFAALAPTWLAAGGARALAGRAAAQDARRAALAYAALLEGAARHRPTPVARKAGARGDAGTASHTRTRGAAGEGAEMRDQAVGEAVDGDGKRESSRTATWRGGDAAGPERGAGGVLRWVGPGTARAVLGALTGLGAGEVGGVSGGGDDATAAVDAVLGGEGDRRAGGAGKPAWFARSRGVAAEVERVLLRRSWLGGSHLRALEGLYMGTSRAVVGHALSADVAAVARTLVRAGVARRAQIEAIDTACNLQTLDVGLEPLAPASLASRRRKGE